MIVKLHKNARTTPAVRAQLAASTEPVAVLAKRFNLAPNTVRKWQARTDFNDRSHTAHNLQTTLNSAQEHIVVYLRKKLLLPLDDLLNVTREFLCSEVSRSGLNRCLRRHGVGNLREMTRTNDGKPKYQRFKDYPIGFVHIDIKYLPQMPDESKRKYLFVAIDRATRMVCVQLRESKTAKDAREFLKFVTERFPFKIKKILTDNGKEFTNKVFGNNANNKTHEFDELCLSLGIEHRLTKVRRPQTNGMVERFNGRIADILRTHHFQSGKELEHTLMRYVDLYNNHLPQANLDCRTPAQVMYECYENNPQFFDKDVHNRTEGDTDLEIIDWYNQRGECSENRIKELKCDFGAEDLPCSDHQANSLYFFMCILAYNLFVLMRALAPTILRNYRAKRVRWLVYRIAGKVVRGGRQLRLNITAMGYEILEQLVAIFQAVIPPPKIIEPTE